MSLKELAQEYLKYARKVAEEGSEDLRLLEEAYTILRLEAEGRLEAELKRLAAEYGGCASCRYSRPAWPRSLSLTARFCALGLRQDGCGRREPLA